MSLFGTIVKAAAPVIIGSLFKKKEKKPKQQTTTSSIDYVKLRKSAEAAGFNPLTALRAGGGAGFQTTHHPVLSSTGGGLRDTLAGGLIAGVDAALSYDPLAEERAQIEQQLLKAQLDNVQANTAHVNRLDALVATAPTQVRQTVGSSMINPKDLASGAPVMPEMEIPEAINPWPKGWGVHVNPDQPNAEMYEDRYGDIIGSLLGSVVVGARDIGHNLYRNRPEWWDDYVPSKFGGL